VAALTVGIGYGRWPARIVSGIAFAFLAPHLFGGLQRLDVGPVGHCCAILVGVVAGFFFQRAWRAGRVHNEPCPDSLATSHGRYPRRG
jgi:membrane protease YdiL (CAAX protease family)